MRTLLRRLDLKAPGAFAEFAANALACVRLRGALGENRSSSFHIIEISFMWRELPFVCSPIVRVIRAVRGYNACFAA